ncbi:hypothetical protein ACTJKN_22925 [Pedobacter sp. 22163]|uniref:hypothetical protein n=1 Tax=Pedobacter sp. 22163 TaxID=3453883 RepID=UPI003F87763B
MSTDKHGFSYLCASFLSVVKFACVEWFDLITLVTLQPGQVATAVFHLLGCRVQKPLSLNPTAAAAPDSSSEL